MDAGLPAPFVPSDVDLRDFKFFPLEVATLRDSRFTAVTSGDEFRAGLLLWCASWHQLPASSLPDDDTELCSFAGYGRVLAEWRAIKAGAMHGWVKCSDGRFYHRKVAEKAIEAWRGKLEHQWRMECARIKKRNQRSGTAESTPDFEEWLILRTNRGVPRDNNHCPQGQPTNVLGTKPDVPRETALKGQGQGQGQGQSSLSLSSKAPEKLNPQSASELSVENVDNFATTAKATNGHARNGHLQPGQVTKRILAAMELPDTKENRGRAIRWEMALPGDEAAELALYATPAARVADLMTKARNLSDGI